MYFVGCNVGLDEEGKAGRDIGMILVYGGGRFGLDISVTIYTPQTPPCYQGASIWLRTTQTADLTTFDASPNTSSFAV